MKNILTNSIKLLAGFLGIALLVVSCEYKEVADANYPAQKLYMPSAINGIFYIDNVPQRVEFLPTPGQTYRFTIDVTNNKLIIPLSVYRGGVDRSGLVTSDIVINTDTIAQLKANSKLPVATEILPASKYTLPASVNVADGKETGSFNLEIDLAYLRSFPDAVLALGVGITSSQVPVNSLLKTTVIVIYTKILNPTANFTANIDATDKAKVTFVNTSTYQIRNLWNFGDGGSDTIKAPVHIYATSGTYNVTLTAVGVLGSSNQSIKTSSVVILLLPLPNFTFAAQSGNAKQIIFTNTSTKCVSYSWNFGDGTPASTETSPSHTYAAAGTYSVVLTGKGDTGATATKTVSVTVI
jgi:hypothetical protein